MAIPWSKLLSMSPAIAEGGRALWKTMAQRRPTVPPADTPQERAAALEVRLDTLEKKVAQLGEEAAASFEVVKSITQEHSRLAEHHAELVEAVDWLRSRTRMLAWLCGVLALLLVGVIALVAIR